MIGANLGKSLHIGQFSWLVPVILIVALAAGIGLGITWQPIWILAAVLAIPLGLAVLFWPDIATLIVIFGVYSNAPVVGVRFHGLPYMVGAAFPLLLVFPLIVILLFQRQKLIFTPVLPLMVVFLGIQLLGVLFAREFDSAVSNIMIYVIEGIGLYFLIVNTVRTPAMLRRVIWALILAGVLIGGIPLYQQVTGTFSNDYGGFGQISQGTIRTGEATVEGDIRQPRLAGPIGEQNRYAQVMLVLVPLGLFLFWGERSITLKAIALAATAVIAVGMSLAFSRGAAVGFALTLVLMVFTRNIKLHHFAAALLLGAMLLAAFPQYGMRLVSLQNVTGLFSESSSASSEPDGAIKGRATAMLGAAMTFIDHPIIGVGPGMVKYYTQEYGNRLGFRILAEDREAHSLYLQIAANHGILGLVVFLAILYVTLRDLVRARKRWKDVRPDLANMLTGVMLALISYLTTAIFLHLSYARYFWLVLALANAAVYIAKNQGEQLVTAPSNNKKLTSFATTPSDAEGLEG